MSLLKFNKQCQFEMFIDHSQIPLNRQQHKKVVRIIHNLLNMPESVTFRKPVCYRALGLDDYKDIVKKPIDLNMIRRLNNEWKYKYVEEVLDDIMLCWNNCRVYNKPGSEIYEKAVEMEQLFVQQLMQQYPDYKIPEGVIKGREPINVAQHIAQQQNNLSSASEKADPVSRQPVNLYERYYARPMHSAADYRGKFAEQRDKAQSLHNSSQGHMQMNSRGDSRNGNSQSEKERSEVEVPLNLPDYNAGDSENIVWRDDRQPEGEPENVPEEAADGMEVEQPEPVIDEQPHQPIIIKLPEHPTLENLVCLSEKIKLIKDKNILRGIVKIMMDNEPDSATVNGDTHKFNASNMRLSTFLKIDDFVDLNAKD